MTKNLPVPDASQGTALWALNRFRADALVNLMKDLDACRTTGMTTAESELVRSGLANLVDLASAVPDSSYWRKALWKEIRDFAHAYYDGWCHVVGSDDKAARRRDDCVNRMRHFRNRAARRIRENQKILGEELDLKLIEAMYDGLGELAKELPEILRNTSRAVARFAKCMGG